ncbi:MAG: hypothetical protein ACLTLX_11745, partial [Ruthenibacterium lactatiformans]
ALVYSFCFICQKKKAKKCLIKTFTNEKIHYIIKKTAKVDSKYLFCNFSLKNSFKTLRFYHWRLVPHG